MAQGDSVRRRHVDQASSLLRGLGFSVASSMNGNWEMGPDGYTVRMREGMGTSAVMS